MKPATREWVDKAEADYSAALILRRSRKKHSRDIVCFHLQQCVEKYLKARLGEAAFAFPEAHEDSPLGLDIWFVPIWSITNAKNGISSCELARATGITQKSAWHLLHRVRHAMHTGSFQKFVGVVESGETYVGGKAKNMHKGRRQEKIHGIGGTGKAVVHGLLERTGKKGASKVEASVVPNVKGNTLNPIARDNVEIGSHLYTDSLQSYNAPAGEYVHSAVDHAVQYVNGTVHTNGMENFWALFKRCIHGTYVAVDEPHLQRYVDEEVFRFNEREQDDAGRFATVMPGIVGKRLMWKTLTGQNETEGIATPEREGGSNELLN